MNNWENIRANGKIWFYGANRTFSEHELAEITTELNKFCSSWAAHGEKLNCGFKIIYNQVILIGVDEQEVTASGCSIDSSVGIIRNFDSKFQLDLFNRMRVYTEENDKLASHSSQEIKEYLLNGDLTSESLVLNTTVLHKKEIESNRWLKISESWLSRFIPAFK